MKGNRRRINGYLKVANLASALCVVAADASCDMKSNLYQ